jgi:hypothetical protein
MSTVAASPSMIGRKSDLDALRDEFELSLAGRPRAVVVGGEAGIGKTRLIDEFTAGVSADALVLIGKCLDLGADGAPYAPFTAVLRALSSALGAGDEGAIACWRRLVLAGPSSPCCCQNSAELRACLSAPVPSDCTNSLPCCSRRSRANIRS